jgi:hypothetical protein
VRKRGPFAIANWVPFPYLGPLVEPQLLNDVLAQLSIFEKAHRIAITQLSVSPWASDLYSSRETLEASKYEVESDQTVFLQLAGRTQEEIWKAVSRRVRRSVGKAEKANAVVTGLTRDDIVNRVPEIMAETFGAQGRPSDTPPGALLAVWDALEPTGAICGHGVVVDGELAAFTVDLALNRRMYGWLAGGLRKHRETQALSLATWTALMHALDRGCSQFDMVGTPTPAITEYKMQFDGQLRDYVVSRSVNSKLYLLGQRAHNGLTLLKHRIGR